MYIYIYVHIYIYTVYMYLNFCWKFSTVRLKMCTICCLDCEPNSVAGNQIVSDHFDSMFLHVYWKLIDPFDAITTKH